MNLGACRKLRLAPVVGVWFRTVELRFLEVSLNTSHTKETPSRFSGGPEASRPFEVLYLCENTLVSHFEVGALLGSHWDPASILSRPGTAWADINVSVRLQFVADLTEPSQQQLLGVTVQEMTGDWQGYQLRSPRAPVPLPLGLAPTQQLGEALFRIPQLEGFFSVSAKVPDHRNLNVFPEKLQPGSQLVFEYADRGIRLEVNPPRPRARKTSDR